jgi:hypothetical protein
MEENPKAFHSLKYLLKIFSNFSQKHILKLKSTLSFMQKKTCGKKMCFKWWVLTICTIVLAESASAQVAISQVLYNPKATESGGEAVELHNYGSDDIDISGWVIATEASASDAVIPDSIIICAGCYYLVADKGWNDSRDNLSWPDADLEEPITMYNTDSGVALLDNETIIDAVGWGNPSEIENSMFEENPHPGSSEGKSLLREKDTGSNIDDFVEAYPFFRSSSNLGTGLFNEEINVEFEIVNSSEEESSVSIDYINISQGTKISPLPGGTAQITLNAQVTGQDIVNVTAKFQEKTISMAKTKEVDADSSVFSGSFGLDFYLPPGEYLAEVNANGEEKIAIEFEYLPIVAVELSKESIDFGYVKTEEDYYSTVTIRNIGNTVVDIGLGCNGFISDDNKESTASVYYSFDNSFKKIPSNTIIEDINLAYGGESEAELKFKLVAPENSTSGDYTGSIKIAALGSED